ncbi:hypothetical protein [Novosphingobium mangrovi (ex Huang et al. 2023)]|uniref:Haem-binding uptake Tiki superfamily ChaN domain-containing protein n=1 Tax=Novosphingobium mangrovi (ex Huang et al. 2023) TaxID=2976432 RepID=A0ABT2I3J1_9SPHN|nr:hypothetical protein [Novosphingobium mangrovi (ex Huang et al. 2023)]MCT2399368.1 hypothetical protein [Novosphingobium mangrovi (ex Huang et al. 2023)]
MLQVMLLAGALLPACTPIDGADTVFADKSVEWIVIGESHGTKETPEVFADLLCLAAVQGRKPGVALEMPETMAADLDAYLASDGGPGARKALLAHDFWQGPVKDGRSSAAMIDLLETLRKQMQAGRIAAVVPIQPSGRALRSAEYERAMAKNVEKARTGKGADLTLVLVGNFHARLASGGARGPGYLPMAGFLPQGATRSFNATGNGGAEWNCVLLSGAKEGAEPKCGMHDWGPARTKRPRGIVFATSDRAGYTGWLNMGLMTTASPPAVPFREETEGR